MSGSNPKHNRSIYALALAANLVGFCCSARLQIGDYGVSWPAMASTRGGWCLTTMSYPDFTRLGADCC